MCAPVYATYDHAYPAVPSLVLVFTEDCLFYHIITTDLVFEKFQLISVKKKHTENASNPDIEAQNHMKN